MANNTENKKFPPGITPFKANTSGVKERLEQLCDWLHAIEPPVDKTNLGFLKQVNEMYKPLTAFLATPKTFDAHSNKTVCLLTGVALGELFRIIPAGSYSDGPLNIDQLENFVNKIMADIVIPSLATETADSDNFRLAVRAVDLVRNSKALCAISSPTGFVLRPHQKSAQQEMMQKIYYAVVKVAYFERLEDPDDQVKMNLVHLIVHTLFGGTDAIFPPESIVLAILHEYIFNAAKGDNNQVSRFMEQVLLADIDRIEPVLRQVICSELNKYAPQGYMPREKLLWTASAALFVVSPLFVKNILSTLDNVMRLGSEERRMLFVAAFGTMWANEQFYQGNLVRPSDRQFIEQNFLARGKDASPKVRQQVVACLPAVLFKHYNDDAAGEDVVAKARDAIKQRLLDVDESVREATLLTLKSFAHDASKKNIMKPFFLLFDRELVEEIYMRIRDVSVKVRHVALHVAVGAYVYYLRAYMQREVSSNNDDDAESTKENPNRIENVNDNAVDDDADEKDARSVCSSSSAAAAAANVDDDESSTIYVSRSDIEERFAAFPGFLLETYSVCPSGAEKLEIERMFIIALFSLDEVSAEQRAKRLVCLYCSLVDTSFDVLHLIMAHHFRTHEYMRILLQEVQLAKIRQQSTKKTQAELNNNNKNNVNNADAKLDGFDTNSSEFQRIRMRLEQLHLSDPTRNMSDGYQQIIELVARDDDADDNADAYRYVARLVLYKFVKLEGVNLAADADGNTNKAAKNVAEGDNVAADADGKNKPSKKSSKLLKKDDPRPLLNKFLRLCGDDKKSVFYLAGERIAERIVPFKMSSDTLSLVVKYAVDIACSPADLNQLFIPASGYGRLSAQDIQKRALQLTGEIIILHPNALMENDSLSRLMSIPETDDNAELASAAMKVLIKWCKTVNEEATRHMLTKVKLRLENLVRRLARGSSLQIPHDASRRASDSLTTTSYSPYVAKEAIRFLMEISDDFFEECRMLLEHLKPLLLQPNDVRCVSAIAVIGDMADLIERVDVYGISNEPTDDIDAAVPPPLEKQRNDLRAHLRKIFLNIVEPKLIREELNRSSLTYKLIQQQNVEAERVNNDPKKSDWERKESTESLISLVTAPPPPVPAEKKKSAAAVAADIDNADTPEAQRHNDDDDEDDIYAEDRDSPLDLSEMELDQVASAMRASQLLSGSGAEHKSLSAARRRSTRRRDAAGNMEAIAELVDEVDRQENALDDADDDDDADADDEPHSAAMVVASQQINTNMSVLRSLGGQEFFRPKTVLPVRIQTKLYAMRALGKWAQTLARKRDSVLLEDRILKLFYNIVRAHSRPNTASSAGMMSVGEEAALDGLPKRALRELDRCYTIYTASVVLLRLYRRFNPSFGVEQFRCLSAVMKHSACPFSELRRKYCQKLKRLSHDQMPVWVLVIFAHVVALEEDANDDALRDYVADIMHTTTTQFRQLVMESPGKQARYLPELCLFYAVYYLVHLPELQPLPPPPPALANEPGLHNEHQHHEWSGDEPALQSAVRMLNFIIEIISRVHPQFTLNAATVIVQRIKTCQIVVDPTVARKTNDVAAGVAVGNNNAENAAAAVDDDADMLTRDLTRKAWALADLLNDLLTSRFVHRVPGPLLNVDINEPTALFKFQSNLNANSLKRNVTHIQAFLRVRAKPYSDCVQIGKPSTLATQSSTQFESHAQVVAHEGGRSKRTRNNNHVREEPGTPMMAGGRSRQVPTTRRAFTTPKRRTARTDDDDDDVSDADDMSISSHHSDAKEEVADEVRGRRRVTSPPLHVALAPGGLMMMRKKQPKAQSAKAILRYLQPPSSSSKRLRIGEEDDEVPNSDRVLRSHNKQQQQKKISAPANIGGGVTPQLNRRGVNSGRNAMAKEQKTLADLADCEEQQPDEGRQSSASSSMSLFVQEDDDSI